MKVGVFFLVFALIASIAHGFIADPVIDSFTEFFKPYITTMQGRVKDVDLWYDRKSKTYEIHAEFPGVNESNLKIWGDETNMRKPILYLEITSPPKISKPEEDSTANTRGGNAVSPSSSTAPKSEKITLRVLLPEDADFRSGVYKLKDGVFSASVPRNVESAQKPKRVEVPLSLTSATTSPANGQ
eukprot:GDKJ01057350.1.p1 GENE.GDKJ01057350.1~~GDKJ01057350.1.p1  ORF type:complete len:185 (-),score=38.25 GDKJ01057350.1:273-827(-)